MPRQARIDAPGALHHIIARGIGRKKIFNDDIDRQFFIDRFGMIIEQIRTQCLAWALMPNHFHLLLKSGTTPVSSVMKRILTGYAMHYNRRHKRHGHLFQNRYKSILCQEETYLKQLIRYIHLNPLRAKLVADMKALDRYRFCGHGVVMGKFKANWQDAAYVIALFGDQLSAARRRYRTFVQKGIAQGKRDDLAGGGLVRSAGGWAAVKAYTWAGTQCLFTKPKDRQGKVVTREFGEVPRKCCQQRWLQRYQFFQAPVQAQYWYDNGGLSQAFSQ